MKKLFISLLFLLLLFLTACSSETNTTREDNDKVVVTTTIGQIADGVKNIGGDHVKVYSLMGPGVDPHLYKATQSDLSKLEEADIIFYNGLNLEGQMNEIFEKMKREKVVYGIAETIDKNELLYDEDNKNAFDPHIWFDLDLWIQALEQVKNGLIEMDPDNKEAYEENANAYFEKLRELKEFSLEKMGEIPEEQRVLVTAHDAFSYFGRAYDMEVMGLQGLSTESEYGLADIKRLIDTLVERNIKAVFVESSISERSIQSVIEGAKEKGHSVSIGGELYSDAMGEEGTEEGTYIGMYKHNVTTISEALK